MKGNCHAPVLTQEHLSREEHAKCAGHVLTIPTLLPPYTHTYTCAHTQFLRGRLMLYYRLSDSMPVKLSLAPSHMQEKVRLMKKKKHMEGGSRVRITET